MSHDDGDRNLREIHRYMRRDEREEEAVLREHYASHDEPFAYCQEPSCKLLRERAA